MVGVQRNRVKWLVAEGSEMATTKRKKKPARERGYQTIEEVAAGLRALAAQLVQDNKGRLAKVSLNIWYEEDDELDTQREGEVI